MHADLPVESKIKPLPSFEDWYQHGGLAQYVAHRWTPGGMGSSLFESNQPAGDMSDPPTPDIALVLPLPGSSDSRIRIDVGAGLFEDRVRQNHLFLHPAHAINNVMVDGPHRLLILSVPLQEVNRTLERLGIPAVHDFGHLHANYFTDPLVESGLLRLREWCSPAHASHGLARESLLSTMMVRLAELARGPSAPAFKTATGGLARWQAMRVIDRMHSDLATSPPLEDLAASVGLSAYHFCRAFKKSLGLSPIQYLIAQRMDRAAKLLLATELPVAEIAQAVGYEDPAYFARLFRQKTALTPSELRRQRVA